MELHKMTMLLFMLSLSQQQILAFMFCSISRDYLVDEGADHQNTAPCSHIDGYLWPGPLPKEKLRERKKKITMGGCIERAPDSLKENRI